MVKASRSAVLGLAAQPFSHVLATVLTTLSFAYLVGGIPANLTVLLVVMFGILSAAQNAVNAWTDIVADRMSWPKRPAAMGAVSSKQATAVSITLLVAGILLLGWVLTLRPSLLLIMIMALDIFLRVAYSTPPLRLKRYPFISNLIISSFAVSFPFAATLTLSYTPNTSVLPVAVVLLFQAVATLILEDFVTIEGDRAIGDVTLPLLLGRTRASLISIALYVAGMVVALASFAAQTKATWLLVAIVILFQAVAASRLRYSKNIELQTYHLTGALVFVTGFVLVLGYAAGLI